VLGVFGGVGLLRNARILQQLQGRG